MKKKKSLTDDLCTSNDASFSLQYAVIGDLHLGHNRTPTEHTIASLKMWLGGVLNRIKVLFFTGDVFDKLISYPSHDAVIITLFIKWVLNECSMRNIVVRVLEGTRSHDWEQSHMFVTMNSSVNVKWIREVSIEYIPVLDMHVLYVPDEANRWCKDTLEQVHKLLIKHKLSECDIAMMHGVFKYQLSLLPDTHNQAEYEAIVKHNIYIGHIHTRIVSGKVQPPGSFERLAHNEEELKGAILATYDGSTVTNEFIPNATAYPYISINVADVELAEAFKLIKSNISGLRFGRIRIIAKDGNPILENIMTLRQQHLLLVIETHRLKTKHVVETIECDYATMSIGEANILETMESYLKSTDAYDEAIIKKLKEYL